MHVHTTHLEMGHIATKSLGAAAALIEQPGGDRSKPRAICAMQLVVDVSQPWYTAAAEAAAAAASVAAARKRSHGVLGVRVDAPGSSTPVWHAVAPGTRMTHIDVLGSFVCAVDLRAAPTLWLLRLPSPDVEVVDIERGAIAMAVEPAVIACLPQSPTRGAGVDLVDACLLPFGGGDNAVSLGIAAASADGTIAVYAADLHASKLCLSALRVLRMLRPSGAPVIARVGRLTLDGQVRVAVLDSAQRRILVYNAKGDVCRTYVPGDPETRDEPRDFMHHPSHPSIVSVVTSSGILASYVDASAAAAHPHAPRTFAAMTPKFVRATGLRRVSWATLLTTDTGDVYRLDGTRTGSICKTASPDVVDLTQSGETSGETTDTDDDDDMGATDRDVKRALSELLNPKYVVHEI